MALSDLCPEKAQETVAFLCKVLGLFTSMQITNKRRTHASWKSVLAGVIITATTALRLHEYYIEEKGFKSLMLSRFTQDALDNLFNTIRLKSPVPRAREFKSALRLTVLDQFFKPSRHGSYDADDSVHLAKFLESRPDISCVVENDVIPAQLKFSARRTTNLSLPVRICCEECYQEKHTVQTVQARPLGSKTIWTVQSSLH